MGKITKFLKEFPDKWMVVAIFLILLAAYLWTLDAFLQRLVDAFSGAVIALLVRGFIPQRQPSTDLDSPIFHTPIFNETSDNQAENQVEKY